MKDSNDECQISALYSLHLIRRSYESYNVVVNKMYLSYRAIRLYGSTITCLFIHTT